jgi:hypothetical protein
MPIMAAHERSDARGAARLLASMALECIDNPKVASDQEVILNNVYRLLESYRSDEFFGLEPPTRKSTQSAAEKLTLIPPMERHVREVREALEQARAAAFAGQSKDRAIASIEKVLRAVAYPERTDKSKVAVKDRKRASLFFQKLIEQLQLG